jgi:hypothetical protein
MIIKMDQYINYAKYFKNEFNWPEEIGDIVGKFMDYSLYQLKKTKEMLENKMFKNISLEKFCSWFLSKS